MGMSCQGAANQLARAVVFLSPGQAIDIEHRIQIAIAMHQVAPCGLKIAFRQLGFDEEIAQFQIRSWAPFLKGIPALTPNSGGMPGGIPSREQTAWRRRIPG